MSSPILPPNHHFGGKDPLAKVFDLSKVRPQGNVLTKGVEGLDACLALYFLEARHTRITAVINVDTGRCPGLQALTLTEYALPYSGWSSGFTSIRNLESLDLITSVGLLLETTVVKKDLYTRRRFS